MLTVEERRAVWIAAMKYGFNDFAKLVDTTPQKLKAFLQGKIDLDLEKKVRRHWDIVKEMLYGGVRK